MRARKDEYYLSMMRACTTRRRLLHRNMPVRLGYYVFAVAFSVLEYTENRVLDGQQGYVRVCACVCASDRVCVVPAVLAPETLKPFQKSAPVLWAMLYYTRNSYSSVRRLPGVRKRSFVNSFVYVRLRSFTFVYHTRAHAGQPFMNAQSLRTVRLRSFTGNL